MNHPRCTPISSNVLELRHPHDTMRHDFLLYKSITLLGDTYHEILKSCKTELLGKLEFEIMNQHACRELICVS